LEHQKALDPGRITSKPTHVDYGGVFGVDAVSTDSVLSAPVEHVRAAPIPAAAFSLV
jgi:hypothetical protein